MALCVLLSGCAGSDRAAAPVAGDSRALAGWLAEGAPPAADRAVAVGLLAQGSADAAVAWLGRLPQDDWRTANDLAVAFLERAASGERVLDPLRALESALAARAAAPARPEPLYNLALASSRISLAATGRALFSELGERDDVPAGRRERAAAELERLSAPSRLELWTAEKGRLLALPADRDAPSAADLVERFPYETRRFGQLELLARWLAARDGERRRLARIGLELGGALAAARGDATVREVWRARGSSRAWSRAAARRAGRRPLKYEVQVEKEEELIEAYAVLNTLWGQILGLRTRRQAVDNFKQQFAAEKNKKADDFLEALLEWEKAISELDSEITKTLGKYKVSRLKQTEVDDIETARSTIDQKKATVSAREGKAIAVATRWVDATDTKIGLIREFRGDQKQVFARAQAFDQRAQKVVDGVRKIVKGSKAGNVVTVTLTAAERNGSAEDEVVTLEYFVRSKLPLVFHAGYGQGDLDDFQFEKVRTAEGLEAFDLVQDEDGTDDVMVFLSVPVYSFDSEQEFELLATLGTGLENAGENLFAGLSVKLFKRFVISYGQASAEVSMGVDPFFEQVGETLESRELFATIDTRRDWGTFWGVSFLLDF